MIYNFALIAMILASANFANAARQGFVAMDKFNFQARDDFTVSNSVSLEGKYHQVTFAVKQNNIDQLEKILFEVSDPKSPKYGKFLKRDEIAKITAHEKSSEALLNYLKKNGIAVVSKTTYGEYITARAPISVWEQVLNTKFQAFIKEGEKSPLVRALEYSLESDIASHVSHVFGVVDLPPVMTRRAPFTKKVGDEATGSVNPAFLNSYYHITSNTGSQSASQAVFESLEQYYSPADLTQFQQTYNLPVEAVYADVGGYVSDQECLDDANNCVEANLDVEYLMAVAQNTPTTYWYDGASDSFLDWIKAVASTENPPLVHSISYGAIENSLPKFTCNSFNTEAMKLGVQGVSILVSSGDDGVANFQARSNPKKCGYNPSFPASSPYVTAVGATQGPESGSAEIACQSDKGGVITTGGGFSTVYAAPAYQKNAISQYFGNLTASQQPASGYATSGRGYPDVSMAGYNYEVIVGGVTYKVSGTSASAPVTAGMVSLVNSARINAGKSPLGFLNTAIYSNGGSFANDVTSGENNCAASKVCCDQGFYATHGWDPLTGFGSVDYAKFYDLFFNL